MRHAFHSTLSALVVASVAAAFAPTDARAQGTVQGGWSTGTTPQGWSTGPAQPAPFVAPPSTSQSASDIEVGTLYALSAGYGVGTGIWIDAELNVDDPGLMFLAPAILGLAGPVGVFFADRPRMPRGMPAAIAAGMAIGAGEGVGISSYQYVHASEADAWGFRGFARSVFIGSTVGTAAGYVAAVTMEPSPKTSMLLGSSVAWGTVIGSMFGYGGSNGDFGEANDSTSLGGFVGYNAGLLGAGALSMVWVPTYKSLAWMWTGFGAGIAVSLPIYLFYAGGNHEPRRGLIFQGTAGTLGLLAGAVFSLDSSEFSMSEGSGLFGSKPDSPIQVTGGGLMPVPGGMGLQVSGLLF